MTTLVSSSRAKHRLRRHLVWKLRFTLFICAVLVLTSLGAQSEKRQGVAVKGVLVTVVGVGGESSGWAIRLDEEIKVEGKPTKTLEVTGPKEDFAKLKNKSVDAVGDIVIRHGVERGDWPVLEINAIHEAASK
jgi:hypothetical protein